MQRRREGQQGAKGEEGVRSAVKKKQGLRISRGEDAPTKEVPHSLMRPDLTVSGRRPKDWAMGEYAPLTQSVRVTFVGTFGTEPPSATVVTMDSMFVNEIVPVYSSRLSSVSVTHNALPLFMLRRRGVGSAWVYFERRRADNGRGAALMHQKKTGGRDGRDE